jgi:hypothetical protein
MAKRLLAAVIAASLLLSLSACAGSLSGSYKAEGAIMSQTVTFFKDKTLALSAFGLSVSGAYVIKSDKIAITYEVFGSKLVLEKSFRKEGNSVFIDGVQFMKE